MLRADRNAAGGSMPRRGPQRLALEVDETEVNRFVTVLKGFDEAALDAYVSGMLRRGLAADRFLLELAAPAARLIGEEWEEDRCDFVDVTLASGRLQRLVRTVGHALPVRDELRNGDEGPSRPSILLFSPAGQTHTLGMLMAGEFFHAAAWQVTLGAPFDATPAAEIARRRWLDVLGISLSTTDAVPQVRDEIRRIRRRSLNRSLGIMVGGPALLLDPGITQTVGADAASTDARLAPDVARAFL
jgi:MerR family transcriptional regulator, light-induced transcriptional regulator